MDPSASGNRVSCSWRCLFPIKGNEECSWSHCIELRWRCNTLAHSVNKNDQAGVAKEFWSLCHDRRSAFLGDRHISDWSRAYSVRENRIEYPANRMLACIRWTWDRSMFLTRGIFQVIDASHMYGRSFSIRCVFAFELINVFSERVYNDTVNVSYFSEIGLIGRWLPISSGSSFLNGNTVLDAFIAIWVLFFCSACWSE